MAAAPPAPDPCGRISYQMGAGTNSKVIQEMLGHGDIYMTMNVYSHSLPTMQAEAAMKWDAALSGHV
jgi:integrase